MTQVLEQYRGENPHVWAKQTVELLLGYVPEDRLHGLESVTLTNAGEQSRKRRRQKIWSRNKKCGLKDALGVYRGGGRGRAAYIELFVDNICDQWPPWALRRRFVREWVFAQVLYHEIGHHIHHTTQPEHAEPEDVADRWADKLTRRLFRRRYWYLWPIGKAVKLKPFRYLIDRQLAHPSA